MGKGSPKSLNIMISSTSLDLPEHRKQVMEAILRLGHFPLAMEHGSAKSDADSISFSLAMVEQADVYIGVLAERYGHKPVDASRNPNSLSVTELEYRRALELSKKQLIYLAHVDHEFKKSQFETDPESRVKLETLKKVVGLEKICGFFKDPTDLRGLVLQSLHELEFEDGPVAPAPPSRVAASFLPAAPALYAVPEYKLSNHFVGRSSELGGLDAWAQSNDAIMVVEGIGGLGKSALTWEWTLNHAEGAIANLSGRVWWSFYEKGTSMVTFVRHALAYVLGQDPESLIKDWSHHQRGQLLLENLRKKPYLLVLDGFERVLAAYHRLDKAQIPDQKVDTALRDCINPTDGDLLLQLLGCGPSKILITTRLMPSGLQDRASHKPIKGVAHHALDGLSPADALELMRQAGIQGNEKAMLEFADLFGRHSLLLRVVCGMIADYRRKPNNFDAWRADPLYGGGLKLSDLDLKQRYTHILHYALRGLNEPTQKLLSRIAVVSENANYDTLAVLNPFSEGLKAFDEALSELENRGLLEWDRDNNRYDMHPVVRGHAAELLEAQDRNETFDKVRDHFEGLPPDDLKSATELVQVSHSLEIYRCFIGAGRFDQAANFYCGDLSNTLLFHVGAPAAVLELLKPLFSNDPQGVPRLLSAWSQGYVLQSLGVALWQLENHEDALGIFGKALKVNLQNESWPRVTGSLRSRAISLAALGRRAESRATLMISSNLAEAVGDKDGVSLAILSLARDSVDQGRYAEADALLAEFRGRPQPPREAYRPGDAEYLSCKSHFFTGTLQDADWQAGYEIALKHRNIFGQHHFLSLRAEWDLSSDRPLRALEAIEQALQITNKMGTLKSGYHDLRAWALAELGRKADALVELQVGEQRLFAAEAHRLLGEREQAGACALNSYRRVWGEGPPFIHWYYLERSRALLKQLGEIEPQLPPFDPAKVPPIPFEKEIRVAIAKLQREKEESAD